jgi:3-oxoacyl-[acyl-carrier protein] reductase
MRRLLGKTALVTGGAAGIGAGIVRWLASEGADVMIGYYSHEDEAETLLNEVRESNRVGGGMVHIDVTKPDVVREAVAEAADAFAGRLDILVNNAGHLLKRVPIAEMEEDFWHSVIDVNLGSVYRVSKAVLPFMPKGGRIVNLSSLAAFDGGGPGAAAYAAAKGGVLTLTRGLAKEFAPKGITVNAVAPGFIEDTAFHNTFTAKEAQQGMIDRTLVKRGGTVDDVAAAVAYLASDEAGFITGEVIQLNGGVVFL